jgi:MoaA/NifB/PqqE/SkfB family radical SAM enzyme
MANLAVSLVCNRACPYCFARESTEGADPGDAFVSMETFEDMLDFLDRSNIAEARLLGGEPTLHPAFVELASRARARGRKLVVFSNGQMPAPALDYLAALPEDDCRVLVNVNRSADLSAIRETLQRLGQRALVGFNLYRLDLDPEFLLPLIEETGCRPGIRLGIAHPTLRGGNVYLRPGQYPAAGRKIMRLARAAAQAGVRLEFDCGFVRCMFSNDDVAELESLGTKAEWRCNPILDINPQGEAIHCYPLADFAVLPLDGTAQAMRDRFIALTAPYRQAGIFKECSICAYRAAGECTGGCLAAAMRRFRHTPFEVAAPEVKPL